MPLYHPTERYPMVAIADEADWEHLLAVCGGHLQPRELLKLKRALGPVCRTVIVERGYVCKDYRDTYTNYYSKKFASYPDKCIRLLFFRDAVEPTDTWDVPRYAGSFVGYVVIRPTTISSLGRMILDPDYCVGTRGFICRTDYKANLMGTELTVNGFPHISQDTDVTVCAHAACWSCFRYFSERYPTYPEIHPYQITQLNTDLRDGRLLPSRGLWMYHVAEMCSRHGFYPRIYDRDEYEHTDPSRFDRLLYYHIESGLPVILGISPDHAVTGIGHTSDLNLAPPNEPGQLFSSHYLTGLVINDDNHLPYETMPRDLHLAAFERQPHVSSYTMEDVDSFVVPLYEKVYLSAESVESKTCALLADATLGIASKAPSLNPAELVVRIFLTTSRAYKLERRLSPLPHDISRIYTQLPMPKFIWVSELSTRRLYPQRQIVGEILWDATAPDGDLFAWLAIHYPEFLIVNDRSSGVGGTDGERQFDAPDPYPLYTHNLAELDL